MSDNAAETRQQPSVSHASANSASSCGGEGRNGGINDNDCIAQNSHGQGKTNAQNKVDPQTDDAERDGSHVQHHDSQGQGDGQNDEPGHDRRTTEAGMWTTEPYDAEFDEYTEWGHDHYGADWLEQRARMMHDAQQGYYAQCPRHDRVYRDRQSKLRELEAELEQGKLPREVKTWTELQEWARQHYGQRWHDTQQKIKKLDQQTQTSVGKERDRLEEESAQLRDSQDFLCRETDYMARRDGASWSQIMRWPVDLESEDPTFRDAPPSSAAEDKRPGAQLKRPPIIGLFDKCKKGPKHTWQRFEWRAIRFSILEQSYEEERISGRMGIRSDREDAECCRRYLEERGAIWRFKDSNPERFELELQAQRDRHSFLEVRHQFNLTDEEARARLLDEDPEWGAAKRQLDELDAPPNPPAKRRPRKPKNTGPPTRQSRRLRDLSVEYEMRDDPQKFETTKPNKALRGRQSMRSRKVRAA